LTTRLAKVEKWGATARMVCDAGSHIVSSDAHMRRLGSYTAMNRLVGVGWNAPMGARSAGARGR